MAAGPRDARATPAPRNEPGSAPPPCRAPNRPDEANARPETPKPTPPAPRLLTGQTSERQARPSDRQAHRRAAQRESRAPTRSPSPRAPDNQPPQLDAPAPRPDNSYRYQAHRAPPQTATTPHTPRPATAPTRLARDPDRRARQAFRSCPVRPRDKDRSSRADQGPAIRVSTRCPHNRTPAILGSANARTDQRPRAYCVTEINFFAVSTASGITAADTGSRRCANKVERNWHVRAH